MSNLKNKTLLITGGTGSFGSKLTEYILQKKIPVKKIIIFSRDEDKQYKMKTKFASNLLEYRLGDVRDRETMISCFKGVDYIFHAAALKHVPSCEFFPIEAVKTNIIGTENVLNLAEESNIKKVVLLSTDKACYPVNAMGSTKMLMEKLMFSRARFKNRRTIICSVRYGNVMFSRGSVLPLFFQQIKEGKDLTITDTNMTRFLMSLSNAIELVMHAINKGQNGDLFIHKAKSGYIYDLARACLKITNSKNKIKIIGIRAGEKISETLATEEELGNSVNLQNFWRIKPATNLNEGKFYYQGEKKIKNLKPYNSSLVNLESVDSICKIIQSNHEFKKMKSEIL